MIKEVIHDGSSVNASHYSAAVRCGHTLYLSGQLPLDPVTREPCRGNAKDQTLRALQNIERLSQQEFGDKGRIVRTTAYITGIDLWEDVNEAYAEFFGDYRPARTIVSVQEIHYGFLVEIESIIVLEEKESN